VQAQLTFTTNNGAITITGYNTAAGLNVVIPAMTNGYHVTSIGDYAFENSGLTNVTIPNSVTNIGTNAFYHCTSLASVTIPNSVTNIGTYAFYYCTSLTSVTIPNSVTNIGDSAFAFCGLTSVTILYGVASVGEHRAHIPQPWQRRPSSHRHCHGCPVQRGRLAACVQAARIGPRSLGRIPQSRRQ